MLSGIVLGQEVCQNGLDDDGDGYVDMADPDCFCYNATSNPSSLIPNSSFEEMVEFPNQTGQIELAKGWKQSTATTPDYFNGDYKFGAATTLDIAASHGTGYVGIIYSAGWKEYIGSCLPQGLKAGTPYQMLIDAAMFSIDADGNYCGAQNLSPVEIVIYGNKHCSALSQPNNYGCPIGDSQTSSPGDPTWVVLGSVTYIPGYNWKQMVIHFTPNINVSSIMIGPPCTLPAGYDDMFCNAYMVFDNLTLNTYSSFFDKVEAPSIQATKTIDCEGTHYTLNVNKMDGATYYWVAPQGNIQFVDEQILLNATGETGLYSCYYIMGNCTSEVATINPFEQAVELSGSEVILPNIITPNGDNVNDSFDVVSLLPGCYTYQLTIVDRWGGLVHKQTNGQPDFAGKNQLGAAVSDGVYFYTLQYQGSTLNGSLTVVR